MILGQILAFDIENHGLLTMHGRVWVPYTSGTWKILMDEAYKSRFSIHPGAKKCIETSCTITSAHL